MGGVDYAVEAKTERISAEVKSAVGASTDPLDVDHVDGLPRAVAVHDSGLQ
jgi:hypothetical protein